MCPVFPPIPLAMYSGTQISAPALLVFFYFIFLFNAFVHTLIDIHTLISMYMLVCI